MVKSGLVGGQIYCYAKNKMSSETNNKHGRDARGRFTSQPAARRGMDDYRDHLRATRHALMTSCSEAQIKRIVNQLIQDALSDQFEVRHPARKLLFAPHSSGSEGCCGCRGANES